MSLAIYAAPFNENSNNINDSNINNDIIHEKRQHNKTQKNYYKESFKPKKENFDQNKVNSVLEKLHEKTDEDYEETEGNNFNPPPKPQSSGVERTVTNENMQNMLNQNNLNMYKVLGKAPQPNYEEDNNLDLNNFNTNYGDSKSVEEYYKKVLPSYVPQKNLNNRPFYNNNNMQINENMYSGNQQDILLQKLNYMINLLEEKQDERTNNVTEEVVLYSFLGIFIIFVVDSFARVGKYVR
jgi:hypothetical protein